MFALVDFQTWKLQYYHYFDATLKIFFNRHTSVYKRHLIKVDLPMYSFYQHCRIAKPFDQYGLRMPNINIILTLLQNNIFYFIYTNDNKIMSTRKIFTCLLLFGKLFEKNDMTSVTHSFAARVVIGWAIAELWLVIEMAL